MIRVSHEIPKQLFKQHDLINDYPYVLAHLLMRNTGHYDYLYADFYKRKLEESSYSIMDNSCFELGKSIDPIILAELCAEYKPTHLILPDVMGNMVSTITEVENFLANEIFWRGPAFIGVIQGKDRDQYFQMLDYYNHLDKVDIIAINFREIEEEYHRFQFINEAFRRGMIKKKLHLLGCVNPLEFKLYTDYQKRFIRSIDTSCPIVHGWHGNRLDEEEGTALIPKPTTKLADNLNVELTGSQLDNIMHNVRVCRSLIHHRRK